MLIRVLFAVMMLLGLFMTGPAIEYALAAPPPESAPVVSGKIKGDYARVTFTWPEAVKFKTAMSGNVLTITFDKPLRSSPAGSLGGLAPYVNKTVLSADRRSVMLTLNQPYPVRSFVSGTSAGVDIMHVVSRPQQAAPPAATPETAKAEPVQQAAQAPAPSALPKQPPAMTKPAPVPVAKPSPPATPTQKPTQATAAEKAPKANAVQEAASGNTTAGTPEEKPAPAPNMPPVAAVMPEKTPPPTPGATPQKLPEVLKEEAATAPEAEVKKPAPRPDIEVVEKTAATGKQMVVTVLKRNVNAEFYFPWKERTASAVFTRGPHLWIVFDRPTPINLTSLNTILPDYISAVEAMDYPGHTVLRMTTTSQVYAAARHRRNTYEWIVTVSRRSIVPAFPVAVEPQSQPPLKPNVMISLLQTASPLALTDPVMGDTLEVIPTHADGNGVFPARRFVDFELLRTAQGAVIKKNNSDSRIVKLRNGLRVTVPGDGVTMTASLPKVDLDQFVELESASNTLLPYSQWKVEDGIAFYAKKHMLQNQIVRANDQKASYLRTELAQLLLASGFHQEAIGVLNQIKQDDPEHYEVYQLAALRGAANFMIDRVAEANLDFADPSLDGMEETDYWKRAIGVMMGDEKKLVRFLHYDPQYSANYPPLMRQKLAVIAADQLLGRKRYNEFGRVIATMQAAGQLEAIRDQVDYMSGRMLADAGDREEAVNTFTRLIAETSNRFVQVRAEFALATLDYEMGKINRTQLIDRLDRLRYIWRGDVLELAILNLLGDLNAAEGQYPDALRAWKDIISNYPGTQQASAVATKMAKAFVALFNEGLADTLEPLEALALYDEFRELTPIGKDGDRMIQNLADRLAGVDLLDRAAALLSHQVKYRLEKEDRSRVGARLGLIHLFNREPRKTLEVLELTGYGALANDLQRQRNQLAAMAYGDIGDIKTALDMLKDDFSAEAKNIRLDMFWNNKDWPNVVTTAEDILASRRDITAPLSEVESQTLIRLAVAYTFEGDSLQLQYLRDYFSPLMEGNPMKGRFLFISNDTGPINPKNMAQFGREISDIKSYLEGFRSQVQERGLSSIN